MEQPHLNYNYYEFSFNCAVIIYKKLLILTYIYNTLFIINYNKGTVLYTDACSIDYVIIILGFIYLYICMYQISISKI